MLQSIIVFLSIIFFFWQSIKYSEADDHKKSIRWICFGFLILSLGLAYHVKDILQMQDKINNCITDINHHD